VIKPAHGPHPPQPSLRRLRLQAESRRTCRWRRKSDCWRGAKSC